ncbi:MAG: BTAD domain-containing putative transcriptional regulator [Deinococcales bacterium]
MSLQIQTLGKTQVLLNKSPATFKSKTAEELFFYLLAHPEGKTKEKIFEDLWCVEPNKDSNNRFRVSVHRIRSALNHEKAVLERFERYFVHPEVLAATDLHRLYLALEQTKLTSADEVANLAAYQKLIALYTGDFLPEIGASWASELREELRGIYIRANLELSMLHCNAGACEGAVSALVRALRLDPFIGENYHQKLMTCLSVVEGKYAAIEHYRRFLEFLRKELSDTPMPETLELAERIKNGEQICKPLILRLTNNCPFSSDGSCVGEIRNHKGWASV